MTNIVWLSHTFKGILRFGGTPKKITGTPVENHWITSKKWKKLTRKCVKKFFAIFKGL